VPVVDWIWIDYALAAVVIVSTCISLFRGFFKEALSLVNWVAALWLSWQLGPLLASGLAGFIGDPVLQMWVARLLILIGVLILGGLVSKLVALVLNSSGLTGTDRALGMVFGFGRGIILAGLLVVVLEFLGFNQSAWWEQSKLIPYTAPIADIIRHAAEDGIEYVGDAMGSAAL